MARTVQREKSVLYTTSKKKPQLRHCQWLIFHSPTQTNRPTKPTYEASSPDSTHPIYEHLARNISNVLIKTDNISHIRTINITGENLKHNRLTQMYYNS